MTSLKGIRTERIFKDCGKNPEELLSILASATSEFFDVRAFRYYSNHVLVVETKKDAIVVDVVYSKKETNVPYSQLLSLRRTAFKLLRDVLSRCEKSVSGVALFFVGNFAEKRCRGEVAEVDKVPCAVHVVKNAPNADGAWVGYVFSAIKKWLASRIRNLERYCTAKGEDDNVLLDELKRLHASVSLAEKRSGLLPDLRVRATVLTATALLRSLGVPTTVSNVLRVANAVWLCLKDGGKVKRVNEEDVRRVLETFCVERGKTYRPLKSLVACYTQFLSNFDGKFHVLDSSFLKSLGRSVRSALPLYVAHWLTRRGIVPTKWDYFANLVLTIADLARTVVNGDALDRLQKACTRPAVLLTRDAALDAWRLCYRRR